MLDSSDDGTYFNDCRYGSSRFKRKAIDATSLDSKTETDEENLNPIEEELQSRTICHTEEEQGGIGNSLSEPLILPSDPRQQIHSVILHLQEGQK